MTLSPRQRARRSATREVAQLVRHTPCLSGARWDGSNVLKLDVDLPYLACGPSPEEPVLRQGFKLAVFLPPGYPSEEPLVAFVAEELIFHPAISPRLATFCMGSALWNADLGLARFVILHLEAIVGLVDIDTLDGLFMDQVCMDAAVHYRRLRESNGLPLARPWLSVQPTVQPTVSSRTRSDAAAGRPMTTRATTSLPGSPARPTESSLLARSPTGRRRVFSSRAGSGAATITRCLLSESGWHDSLTTSGAGAFRWLSGRTRAETTFALELVHGAPALRLEGSTDAVAQGSGGKSQESLRESFERLLRQLELPTLALADPEISKNVLARISHRHRHEVP